jgi:hypothetical protein
MSRGTEIADFGSNVFNTLPRFNGFVMALKSRICAFEWLSLTLWARLRRACFTFRMRANISLPAMSEIQVSKAVQDQNGVTLTATGSGLRNCPDCGTQSSSGKGEYIRRLAGSPGPGNGGSARSPDETMAMPESGLLSTDVNFPISGSDSGLVQQGLTYLLASNRG